MRENRPYGLEGGESGSTGLPYPYPNSQDLCGRSTTKMTFLGLYFSAKSLEKRIEERCAGSLVVSQYKRTA
jgi:hypothetical protein